MFTVRLQNLQFFAHHGLYEEEKKLGNQFVVNVAVQFPGSDSTVYSLNQTINYEILFELVAQHMKTPHLLLETFVSLLAADIRAQFPHINRMEIDISKQSPPILGLRGQVMVAYTWQEEQPG